MKAKFSQILVIYVHTLTYTSWVRWLHSLGMPFQCPRFRHQVSYLSMYFIQNSSLRRTYKVWDVYLWHYSDPHLRRCNIIRSMYKLECIWVLWNSQPCEVQDSYKHSARETKLDVQTSSFSWKGTWIFSMLWSQNKVAIYAHGITREIMPQPMHSWKYFLHSVGRRSVNEKSWNGGPAIHVEFRCNFGIFSIR